MADETHYVTSYKEVSTELGKKLIKLYNAKIFPRQGKIFADMLFQSGIVAGSYLAALADIEERSVKINLATNALVNLNQTEYLVNVMLEAGYYAPVQVVEIQDYLDGLTQAMRELLIAAYAQKRTENIPSLRPAPKAAPKFTPRPASGPVAPPVTISYDVDGFNIPANSTDVAESAGKTDVAEIVVSTDVAESTDKAENK